MGNIAKEAIKVRVIDVGDTQESTELQKVQILDTCNWTPP